MTTYYTVENLNRAHAGSIPWNKSRIAYNGQSIRTAIRKFRHLDRIYHPEPHGWSGHVRLIATIDEEDWLAIPTDATTLEMICRLDDY